MINQSNQQADKQQHEKRCIPEHKHAHTDKYKLLISFPASYNSEYLLSFFLLVLYLQHDE